MKNKRRYLEYKNRVMIPYIMNPEEWNNDYTEKPEIFRKYLYG